MRMLHKHLPCTLNPLMPGHNLLRRYDLGSLGQLNDVVRLRDDPLGIIVPRLLGDYLNLLLLEGLVGGLFPG